MEIKTKNQAVDLTDLAVGILILGIIVTIGATILINIRDSHLTDLATTTTVNESVDISTTGSDTFANTWVSGTTATCLNGTGDTLITSGNYTISVDSTFGVGTISNTTTTQAGVNNAWNCTYSTYDTTRADWAVANDAATGIAEYGNWFDIIVILGVASVILSLIFMAFGRRDGTSGQSY